MRVAAIDCGTNTVKLLVADLDPEAGTEVAVLRELRMVRLGQGVDRAGRIADAALTRVFDAVEEYAAIIAEHDVERTRFCATSAARDAANAEEFMAGVEKRLGVAPEVLSGAEEAELTFTGATRDLGGGISPPYLVVDIGGGSTELVLGEEDGRVIASDSLDIGSVRITERHLAGDPPTRAETESADADVDAALDASEVDLSAAEAVIGVAGSITTVAAMALDLPHYDRSLIDHSVITTGAVQGVARHLLAMTVAERKDLPFMHPGRADVIGAGALILDHVLRRTGVGSMLVSEADFLDGIAWSLVR